MDKSNERDRITTTLIKLGNLPEDITSEDVSNIELLVKTVYFGNNQNADLNQLRKDQFNRSTTNDLKKIAPNSDALYMHILRTVYVAGFEWVECIQNVSIPDPSLRGYILKDRVLVPKWLPNPWTFDLKKFLKICKCKTPNCKTCKCAELKIPCLPLCQCNHKCKRK